MASTNDILASPYFSRRSWALRKRSQGFKAFEERDWRDVAKSSFCGANGHQVEKLIASGGKMQDGRSV